MRRLLTVAEAMQALRCSRTTMYLLTRTGQLATVRVGRSLRIPAEAIDGFIARGGTVRTGVEEGS